jgi:hypothetical protein
MILAEKHYAIAKWVREFAQICLSKQPLFPRPLEELSDRSLKTGTIVSLFRYWSEKGAIP